AGDPGEVLSPAVTRLATFRMFPAPGEQFHSNRRRPMLTFLKDAAPGKLLELIDVWKARIQVYDAAGLERPFWMRHSQGDHWDLLLLFPIESYGAFFSAERKAKLVNATENASMPENKFRQKIKELVAWHEDVFVQGAPLADVKKAFGGMAYFHVEMFIALPGKHAELVREREMENAYLEHIGRPQNLIFEHDMGAAWDVFTIGCYRDLKHFAESADIPADKEDEAARKAGFDGANKIGAYLRTLISRHNDTLAGANR
ncbi:MAG: hypothetical protein ACE5I1_31920, partial [bacterium]